jgi:hypothetical protein
VKPARGVYFARRIVLLWLQYWMWDPALVDSSSPGWANISQDQVSLRRVAGTCCTRCRAALLLI